jgi:prolipoprotein diacylglyceryltransferase
VYGRSVQLLSIAFLALGLVILISTFTHGGGPLSLGTLLGLAFLAVGVARLWLSGLR